jgi:superfamily II DNA/RNA helicase
LRLKIRRLKELKVFNSLRLSVVVAAEVLTDVAADVAADIAADVTAEAVAGRLGYRSRGLDTN